MFGVSKTHALLVGSGVLLGTLGSKFLRSNTAHNLAVQGVAAGMRIKDGYEGIVEQAKAKVDDVVSEAAYLNAQGETCCSCCEQHDDAEADAQA